MQCAGIGAGVFAYAVIGFPISARTDALGCPGRILWAGSHCGASPPSRAHLLELPPVGDGTGLAIKLAATLRSFGIPVWHDRSDLPPGDTNRRLMEAFASGLSGARVLVTPEMAKAQVVKEIELPSLIALEENSTFVFTIANAIMRDEAPSRIDYDAPDRVLSSSDRKLSGVNQFRVGDRAANIEIANAICLQRMAALRPTTTTLDLHIQTRLAPVRATRIQTSSLRALGSEAR